MGIPFRCLGAAERKKTARDFINNSNFVSDVERLYPENKCFIEGAGYDHIAGEIWFARGVSQALESHLSAVSTAP